MYYVWTELNGKKLRVAGCNDLKTALYYAKQYTDEGRVTVKKVNKIVAIFSSTAGDDW